MAAPPPSLADLPGEIAIFPLPAALLLPGGRLPLNIFEPRYLALVEDALGAGRYFGMVQPEPAAPAGPEGPRTYRVGCLGRIASFSETEDGRFLITLAGVTRFRITAELPPRRGYRRVRADYAEFAADLAPDAPPAVDQARLLGVLRPFFKARQIEANWDAIERTEPAMLVLSLSMICPFDVPEKQALLEAPGPTERAATLIALLEMGAHEPGPDDLPAGRRLS